jgi:N-methylhydantoinase A
LGQSYEINVPFTGTLRACAARFHREHAKLYGYSNPGREVEVVTIRVRARKPLPKPKLKAAPSVAGRSVARPVFLDGSWRDLKIWNREHLGATTRSGPALILDYGSTTLVPPGWRFRLDRAGSILIQSRH